MILERDKRKKISVILRDGIVKYEGGGGKKKKKKIPLPNSQSLLEDGTQTATQVCRMFRLPSHLSLRISCTAR